MGFQNLTPHDYSLSKDGLPPNDRGNTGGMFAGPDIEVLASVLGKAALRVFLAEINSAFAKVPTDELYANRKMEALLRLKSHIETAIKQKESEGKASVKLVS